MFTVWSTFKMASLVQMDSFEENHNIGLSNNQDISIGLLGLCYLSTNPAPDEAVTMFKVATLTSVLDMFTRAVTRRHDSDLRLVSSMASVVRCILCTAWKSELLMC